MTLHYTMRQTLLFYEHYYIVKCEYTQCWVNKSKYKNGGKTENQVE